MTKFFRTPSLVVNQPLRLRLLQSSHYDLGCFSSSQAVLRGFRLRYPKVNLHFQPTSWEGKLAMLQCEPLPAISRVKWLHLYVGLKQPQANKIIRSSKRGVINLESVHRSLPHRYAAIHSTKKTTLFTLAWTPATYVCACEPKNNLHLYTSWGSAGWSPTNLHRFGRPRLVGHFYF